MSRRPVRGAGRLRGGTVLVLALLVVALSAASGGTAAGGQATGAASWRDVLERAAEAPRTTPYEGEALLVGRDGDATSVTRVRVRNSLDEGLEVGRDDGMRVRVHADGGGLLDEAERIVALLPAVDLAAEQDLERLALKYEVTVTGADHLMDRPCTTLEIRRRADAVLRERLWVDDASGLLVRRETYEGGDEPVLLATYLSLDLDPPRDRGSDSAPSRQSEADAGRPDGSGRPDALGRPARDRRGDGTREGDRRPARGRAAKPVHDRGIAALREAGWAVPEVLPDGYEPLGVYAVDAVDSQPLQLVYGDGLYVVSVFLQRGTPDWSSLPPGARQVAELDFPAWEWAGAVPHRLVWEADGRTYSIIGDAPPADLATLAAALPRPQPPGLLDRLGRGLGRLWSWVTPWGDG